MKTHNNLITDNDCEWANEFIVLYESGHEHIILHRNMIRGEEFAIMTCNLFNDNSVNRLWCGMANYHHLLEYRFAIQRYQMNDSFVQFKAFFNMTIDEFFERISKNSMQ